MELCDDDDDDRSFQGEGAAPLKKKVARAAAVSFRVLYYRNELLMFEHWPPLGDIKMWGDAVQRRKKEEGNNDFLIRVFMKTSNADERGNGNAGAIVQLFFL